MNKKLREAIKFAIAKHAGHDRKYEKYLEHEHGEKIPVPYIVHPFHVCMILVQEANITDETILISALLHDTIEDTRTSYDRIKDKFGERVADYVVLLSEDKRLPKPRRDQVFHEKIKKADWEVKIIKLADIYDNALTFIDAEYKKKQEWKKRKLQELDHLIEGLPDDHVEFAEKVRGTVAKLS